MADVMGVLVQIARGQAIEEVNREFNHVYEQVRENGGTGEVTIKIKVEATGWNQRSGQLAEVAITHSVGTKSPRRKLGKSTFFVTNDGDLSRNDPAQMELDDMAEEKSTYGR